MKYLPLTNRATTHEISIIQFKTTGDRPFNGLGEGCMTRRVQITQGELQDCADINACLSLIHHHGQNDYDDLPSYRSAGPGDTIVLDRYQFDMFPNLKGIWIGPDAEYAHFLIADVGFMQIGWGGILPTTINGRLSILK